MDLLRQAALPLMVLSVILYFAVKIYTARILRDMDGFDGELSGMDLNVDQRQIIKRF